MSLFKNFRSSHKSEDDRRREAECLARIKESVIRKTGVEKFIEVDDCTVAFAGSEDDMKFILEISTMIGGDGNRFLRADLDDRIVWQEDDFDSPAEFESAISDYLSDRV